MDLETLKSLTYMGNIILSATVPNEMCRNHTHEIFNGIRQTKSWALRMVDSIGKLPSGLIEGNLVNLGNMDECLDVKVDENFGKFAGKYCLVEIVSPVKANVWKMNIGYHWGTCIPSSCTAGDLQAILRYTFPSEVNTDELHCQTSEGRPYETQELVTIGILSFLAVLTIFSTIYDYARSSGDRNKYILSFSLKTNVRNLLDTKRSRGILKTVDGMRVVATFIIILSHMYLKYGISGTSFNMVRFLDWLSDWKHVWLTSRGVAMDVFFVFSGLLASNSFWKGQSRGRKFNLGIHLMHRYIRLMPAMAIMLLFNATLFRRIGSGPLWKPESQLIEEQCRTEWWKFMLFINNWFSLDKCMIQTWYIAVDMQLHFLSPILLLPLQRWPNFGLGLTFASLITAVFALFGIYYIREEHVEIYRNYKPEFEDSVHGTVHRVSPWLIGLITGYFLHKYHFITLLQKKDERRSRQMSRHKILVASFLSVICIVTFVSPVLAVHPFLQPDYQYDALTSAAYLALSRVITAASVVLTLFTCISGYGGFFEMLFSWKIFIPLSRLTYSMYLIHMCLVDSHIYSTKTAGYLSDYNLIMTSISIIFLSLVLSPILYLLVEQPAAILEKLLLQKDAQEVPGLPMSQSRADMHNNIVYKMPEITSRKGI